MVDPLCMLLYPALSARGTQRFLNGVVLGWVIALYHSHTTGADVTVLALRQL